MDVSKLASGDGVVSNDEECNDDNEQYKEADEGIEAEVVEDNDIKIKERIAQCKNIIESLKTQLKEEKEKSNAEKAYFDNVMESLEMKSSFEDKPADFKAEEYGSSSDYSSSVDKKMFYDENLIEYEKQLEKYQNTLNMAQNEKKIAIRKQMMAKAFKLKLMEVENQCNIELLRVKQSLQCLEPLQMIANNWKCNPETKDENSAMYDINNYALMPLFPELKSITGYDIPGYDMKSYKEDLDKIQAQAQPAKKDDATPD